MVIGINTNKNGNIIIFYGYLPLIQYLFVINFHGYYSHDWTYILLGNCAVENHSEQSNPSMTKKFLLIWMVYIYITSIYAVLFKFLPFVLKRSLLIRYNRWNYARYPKFWSDSRILAPKHSNYCVFRKNEGPRALLFSMKIPVYTYVHKTSFTSYPLTWVRTKWSVWRAIDIAALSGLTGGAPVPSVPLDWGRDYVVAPRRQGTATRCAFDWGTVPFARRWRTPWSLTDFL